MKKSIMAAAVTLAFAGAANAATTHTMTDGRFDFKDAGGNVTSDGHNDVQGAFDMVNGTGSFTTSTNFFGFTWNADVVEMRMHNTMMGGTDMSAESHTFAFTVQTMANFSTGDTTKCISVASAGYNGCADEIAGGWANFGGPRAYSYNYTLNAGQFAAHTLFDWSSSEDIPVLAIMQVTNDPMVDGFMTVASVDLAGNVSGGGSLYGVPMIQCSTAADNDGCGPFPGQTPIFSGTIVPVSAVPVPAAVWLFGSGLLGLVGVARRKMA